MDHKWYENVRVCWWNELKVSTTLAYIAIHSVLCQCYTDRSTHASSETIWGQWTDGTKSGSCHRDWVWLDGCCVLRLCRLLIPRFFPLVFHTYRLLLIHLLLPVSIWVVAFVLIRDVSFLWFHGFSQSSGFGETMLFDSSKTDIAEKSCF